MAAYYALLSVPLSNIPITFLFQYPVQCREKGFLIGYPANKEALGRFGLASLQGTVLTAASLAISAVAGAYAAHVSRKENGEKYGRGVFVCTMVICGLAAAGAAMAFPHRLGTPTEVLTNFAVSSVLAVAAIVGIYTPSDSDNE